MKKILFILFFAVLSFFANAQTGTATIDETGSVTFTGGLNPSIASIAWSVQSAPTGATVVFSTPTSLKTDVTVNTAGSYSFLLTVKDNEGNVVTGVVTGTAIAKQVIHLNLKVTDITLQLK